MLDAINLLPRVPRGLFDDSVAYAGPGRAFVASSLTNSGMKFPLWWSPTECIEGMVRLATNDVIVVDLS